MPSDSEAKPNGKSKAADDFDLNEVMVLFEDINETDDIGLTAECEHYLDQAVSAKGPARKRALYNLIKAVADGRDVEPDDD